MDVDLTARQATPPVPRRALVVTSVVTRAKPRRDVLAFAAEVRLWPPPIQPVLYSTVQPIPALTWWGEETWAQAQQRRSREALHRLLDLIRTRATAARTTLSALLLERVRRHDDKPDRAGVDHLLVVTLVAAPAAPPRPLALTTSEASRT